MNAFYSILSIYIFKEHYYYYTTWGASANVLRTSGMALCFSAGKFACPVWHRSARRPPEVDVVLKDAFTNRT